MYARNVTAHRHIIAAVVAAVALGGSSAAFAQQSPALDRVDLMLGGYYQDSTTVLNASTNDGSLAGSLDFERDLGFPQHKTAPRVRLDVLLGDSQGFSFDYYRFDRTRTAALADSFSYDGNIFDASAFVKGNLSFDFGSAAYRWWLGHGNDVFGVGIGAGYYKLKASISGEATVDGQTERAESSTSTDAWAPVLEFGWRHAFNDSWRVYANASGLKKNGGKIHGHIYNAALGAQWLPWKNFGVSAEYGINRVRLYRRHDTYSDNLDLKLKGPSVFATLRF